MRIFATRNYSLAYLPYGARLFYTLFLSMVFLGLLTCLAFPLAKSGLTTAQLTEYYRQQDLGLGGKPFLELLETAHFHLFSMPMFFLVLGHIFFLGSWSERAKLIVIVASYAGLLLQIVLPFLIVYHSAAWAWLLHPARLIVLVTFTIYVFVPIREMWSRESSTEPGADDSLRTGGF